MEFKQFAILMDGNIPVKVKEGNAKHLIFEGKMHDMSTEMFDKNVKSITHRHNRRSLYMDEAYVEIWVD